MKREEGATIKDVAKAAGVSITTVAHALNGNRPVSAETKKRISKVIENLGYVPSYSASHLKTRKSGLIGCYVADLTQDFTGAILKGIEKSIKGSGYLLLFGSGVDIGTGSEDILNYFRKYNVDGLLIIHHLSQESSLKYEDGFSHYPIVFVNVENQYYDSVIPDNVKSGAMVAQHLMECGVRKPLFLGGPKDRISVEKRLKGFKYNLNENNIILSSNNILFGEFTYESGYQMANDVLEMKLDFDGVFCANDFIALGALRRFEEEGIRIPEDIKMVGFDNRDVSKYSSVPITTIDQNLEDLGSISTEWLLSMIKSNHESHGIFYSTPRLIVRQSTISSI